MADNKKIYTIQINGIEQSIKQVDALSDALQFLDKKIKEMESRNVSVSSSNGGNGNRNAELQTEDKLLKQIQSTEQQIRDARREDYQSLLAQKDVLKDIVSEAQERAAAERLSANNYENNMKGLKQELSDIKKVMQTTDLGDSESMEKLIKRANELNSSLKNVEESYGQFGRNVGNYKSAAEGFKSLNIEVNGVTRSFDNAKQALMELKKERDTLGISMGRTSKEFKELDEIVKQLQSDIKDMATSSSAMDNLLDTMQSLTAIGSIGQGFKALFGFDDSEIEKSIQKLVALQNILKGIETINKQIQTREGIGGWIAPFNKGIDTATTKLLVYNRALLGTGKAAKVAATSINVLSKSMKAIASAGILLVISLLTDKILDLAESFGKADKAAQTTKKIQESVGESYAKVTAQLSLYQDKVDSFNGSQNEEKKLVEELNKEFGTALGTYKSLAEWKKVLKERTDAYVQSMMLEAEQQAILNELIEIYQNRWNAIRHLHDDFSFGEQVQEFAFGSQSVMNDRKKVIKEYDNAIAELEERLKKNAQTIQENNKKNGLFDYAPTIKKNANTTKKAVEDGQREINELQLRLMKDGLNKRLMQLDEEERQLLFKLKQNAKKNSAEITRIQEAYDELRLQEIQNYLRELEISIKNTADSIEKVQIEINIKDIELQIDRLKNKFDELSIDEPIKNTIISNTEIKEKVSARKLDKETIDFAAKYQELFDISELTNNGDEYYRFLMDYLKTKDKEVIASVLKVYDDAQGTEKERQAKMFKSIETMLEVEYANQLLIVRNYTKDVDQTLSDSISRRLNAQRVYNDQIREQQIALIEEQAKLNAKLYDEERNAADEAEKSRYQSAQLPLQKRKDELEEEIKLFEARNDEEKEELKKLQEDLATIEKQMEQQHQQHLDKLIQISDEYENKIKTNTIEAANERSAIQEKYFDEQIANLRDAQSKMNELLSRQPVVNSFGVINIAQSKKQYKEIEDAARTSLMNITAEKMRLEELWKKGLITPEAKNAVIQQLNDLEADINRTLTTVVQETKELVPKFLQSIEQYVQAFGQTINQILGSLSEIQSNQYDAMIDKQEKYIEEYEKLLDKQKEITEQHASEVESIEDELSTARGDRRQQLIDQLNAEMAAQRASLAQEKKIEKEREKAEEKKKKLEHDQAVAKKKMQEAQAYINMAMAISMAAVNSWPVPAIPMMALAAAAGAAQIAAIKSQNIPSYGSGGVIQGKSHREGGVKVLGGQAEVEGGEFITNKVTTAKNVDLLEYINTKRKKINLEDLIDFYGGNSQVKKSITTVRTKFADGGMIPTLRNDINLSDRMLTAFEDYSNRPVQVAVVDIIDRTQQVNNVKVMAGLDA